MFVPLSVVTGRNQHILPCLRSQRAVGEVKDKDETSAENHVHLFINPLVKMSNLKYLLYLINVDWISLFSSQ